MMTIELRCKQVGTIQIESEATACGDAHGNCDCGAYDHYYVASAEKMHEVASGYAWVERPRGGKGSLMRGAKYSPRMAQNDFKTDCFERR